MAFALEAIALACCYEILETDNSVWKSETFEEDAWILTSGYYPEERKSFADKRLLIDSFA